VDEERLHLHIASGLISVLVDVKTSLASYLIY